MSLYKVRIESRRVGFADERVMSQINSAIKLHLGIGQEV
jgi:hypothetical protein